MRSQMSITTPMSCSISTSVVPNWSLASRMKRHMSRFSSWFMPAIGSAGESRARPQRLLQEVAAHLQVAAGEEVVEHRHALEERDVLEGPGDAQRRGLAR